MPIKIPDGLPAKEELYREKIYTIDELRAATQDIRPLRILILNLMPKKEETELQLLRLLGNSPLQVDIDFAHMTTHCSKNTDISHLAKFYMGFDEFRELYYDACIITGAPVEKLPFEEVDYFPELTCFFTWTDTHVFSTLHLCWGAQAALYHYFAIPKKMLDQKLFGIFPVHIDYKRHPIIRGFDDVYYIPESRHTYSDPARIQACEKLDILTYSDYFGPDILAAHRNRKLFIMGHLEYDRETLKKEYIRDRAEGQPVALPLHYFPDDDPNRRPPFTWRSHANLLYYNWLNFVYQETPYELEAIKDIDQ